MDVIMLGTASCYKCRIMKPKIESYCKENNIRFYYHDVTSAPRYILSILAENNVRQAPAFVICRGDKYVVVTGDDIFLEMSKVD